MNYDYGRGKTNIDTETGIRYGVISMNKVSSESLNEFEPYYEFSCVNCGHNFGTEIPEKCPNCDQETDETDFDDWSPVSWQYDKNGIKAFWNDGDNYIWVIKSPFYTNCLFCSPCAPGAGDLSAPCEDGAETYALSADFFDGEKAPYPLKEKKS